MHYVLDTGFFRISRDYYPTVFLSFWGKLDKLVSLEAISSVSEVEKEIKNYGGEQEHLLQWTKRNRHIFTAPSEEQQNNVRKIFRVSNFTNLISKRSMLEGKPSADPFLIAKAMTKKSGILVSDEKPAKQDSRGNIQGSYKIPDVCNYCGVRCITPQQFMEEQEWSF